MDYITKLKAIYKLWIAKRKGIHYLLKESEATLYITKELKNYWRRYEIIY